MAEGARLESVYTFTRIEGSNPSLTARIQKRPNRFDLGLFYWLNILLFQLSSTAQLSNEPIRFWIFFLQQLQTQYRFPQGYQQDLHVLFLSLW